MANLKQVKSESLALIDAVMSILDKYPELSNGNTYLSVNTSTNPFEFLMDCFKGTVGYDALINIISTFISTELPALEVAVKGVLLTNIKNLLTCSLNPFITDDILREGIVFDLSQIDITDKLRYSPISQKGKYYYFGCNKCETAMDVRDTCTKKSNLFKNTIGGFVPTYTNSESEDSDFDCLLWYMKNRATKREVWSRDPNEEPKTVAEKENKKDGIVTLEFNESSRSIKNAEGQPSFLQTPYLNVLHVFIGNAQEIMGNNYKSYENELSDIERQLKEINKEIDKGQKSINKVDDNLAKIDEQLKNNEIEYDDYRRQYGLLSDKLTKYENNMDNLEGERRILYEKKAKSLQKLKNASQDKVYRKIDTNYYYQKTLIEFNTDYVNSLRLFDSKVVAARLIDSLTGLLSIDLDLSYKQLLIRNEINKMVSAVIESDDAVVNDCFFSFSNDEYNSMLQKSEYNKMGLYSSDGTNTSGVTIDADSLLQQLNGIDASATKEEINTIIKGSITELSKQLSKVDYLETDQLNFGLQINFIEKLMNNLANVIVQSILSPKVYLLILINLKLLGQDVNFNLEGFIEKFKQLIKSLLRAIRDYLINYLVDKLMSILSDLVKEIAIRMNIEQAQYYARLLKKLIDCIKSKGNGMDFNIDNVDYADIYQQEAENNTDKC